MLLAESLARAHDQGADFVELFFDLVFVFTIPRVPHLTLTAHHLDLQGVIRSLLIFWFAIPYILTRQLGWDLLIRASWTDVDERIAVIITAIISQIGLVVVLIGAMVDPGARAWWWLAAIVADMLAVCIGGNEKGWNIRVKHMVERHSLIVIIVLGESLIVTAGAVANVERTATLLVVGGIAVMIVCLLWWSYFGWAREFFEEHLLKATREGRGTVIRDGLSLGHFPLICGIISFAIGLELILSQPAEPVSPEIVAALGLGMVLFAGSTAFTVWCATRKVLWSRLVLLAVGATTLTITVSELPAISLTLMAVTLGLIVTVEEFSRPDIQLEASTKVQV